MIINVRYYFEKKGVNTFNTKTNQKPKKDKLDLAVNHYPADQNKELSPEEMKEKQARIDRLEEMLAYFRNK